MRLQRNIPEEKVDHRDGDGVHDHVGDPSPLLVVRRLALVHRAASAELRLSSRCLPHLAHLVVDQTLRDDHADGGPEVLAQTLVGGVVEEVVGLADGGQRQQAPDDEADHDERVLR